MSEIKHFLVKAAYLLPLPVIFFSISYFVDPANLFHGNQYEQLLASHLLKGENVTGLGNYDERVLQKELITNLKSRPDWLVLGSSHSMQIHSRHVTGSLINNSVSAAVFEDYLAICELHESNRGLPPNLIFCADPWLFNSNTGEENWASYAEAYQAMAKRLHMEQIKSKPSSLKKNLQLFSPDYFRNACEFLVKGKSKRLIAVQKQENFLDTRLSDGSLVYSESIRNADTVTINRNAGYYLENQPIFMLWEYRELSPEIRKNFNSLLDYLQAKHINIYFFLPPYHPLVQRYFDQHIPQYNIINEAEQYFLQVAAQRQIPVLGSYNPSKLKLRSYDFYDGTHCKTSVIDSLIGNYIHKINKH